MNANADKISWFSKIQQVIFSYFHSDLKVLGFSQVYRPLFLALFLKSNENLEKMAQQQFENLQNKYSNLFGNEIDKEETLLIFIFLLMDSKTKQVYREDQATLIIRSKWPQTMELRVIPIKVNNERTDNSLASEFRFQKHIYLKNKIQTYHISESIQISSLNISDADRCKKINSVDVDLFRETIRKNIYAVFVPFFEKYFNSQLSKMQEIKLSKKKNFWSIFGGETSKPRQNPNEISSQERLQFNIAEMFLIVGNYDSAAIEFKAVAQAFVVKLKEKKPAFLFSLFGILYLFDYFGQRVEHFIPKN